MARYEAIKTGYDPRTAAASGSGEGRGQWLNLASGDVVDVVVLVDAKEIITCEQVAIWLTEGNSPVWVYTGPEDPAHDFGLDKRYRAYLPVLVDDEPKVWSMGKQAHSQILEIADAGGSLKGSVIRIKRVGKELATRYTIIPRGKKKDVSTVDEVDVISMLGPTTTEEIREMLVKRFGYSSYEEMKKSYVAPKSSTRAGRTTKAKVEDDVESLELV